MTAQKIDSAQVRFTGGAMQRLTDHYGDLSGDAARALIAGGTIVSQETARVLLERSARKGDDTATYVVPSERRGVLVLERDRDRHDERLVAITYLTFRRPVAEVERLMESAR